MRCDDFALDATLPEARTNYNSVLSGEFFCYVFFGELFRVDKGEHRFVVVVSTGLIQTLANAFVGVLQVVFSHESDVYLFGGFATKFEKTFPGAQCWLFADGLIHLFKNSRIQTLILHSHRSFVDAG